MITQQCNFVSYGFGWLEMMTQQRNFNYWQWWFNDCCIGKEDTMLQLNCTEASFSHWNVLQSAITCCCQYWDGLWCGGLKDYNRLGKARFCFVFIIFLFGYWYNVFCPINANFSFAIPFSLVLILYFKTCLAGLQEWAMHFTVTGCLLLRFTKLGWVTVHTAVVTVSRVTFSISITYIVPRFWTPGCWWRGWWCFLVIYK